MVWGSMKWVEVRQVERGVQGNMVALVADVWLEQVGMEVLENRMVVVVNRIEALNKEGELLQEWDYK